MKNHSSIGLSTYVYGVNSVVVFSSARYAPTFEVLRLRRTNQFGWLATKGTHYAKILLGLIFRR